VGGVALLLVAALGLWSIWLAAAAVILLMVANGMLIANCTYQDTEYEGLASSAQTNGVQESAQVDMRTCLQGYAMIPVTLTAVVSLAMYKAESDLPLAGGDKSNLAKVQPGAVALLRFIGCEYVLSRNHDGAASALRFHSRFLTGMLVTVALYLAMLGVQAVCMSKAPPDESESSRTRMIRHIARCLFGVTVTLLVFAAVGFWPLILGSAAFALSLSGLCVLFASAAGRLCGDAASSRTLLQAHAFTPVTLACAFCFGCLMFEWVALSWGDEDARDVSLHFSGLEQALFAGTWLAATLAVRDAWNTLQTMS